MAADDEEAVALIYLILRELVSLVAVQQVDGNEVDLGKAQAQIKMALSALTDFDEIARLTTDAQKNITRLFEVGRSVKTKIHEALMGSLSTGRHDMKGEHLAPPSSVSAVAEPCFSPW